MSKASLDMIEKCEDRHKNICLRDQVTSYFISV